MRRLLSCSIVVLGVIAPRGQVAATGTAANANGDQDVDMTDALWLLNFLFRGGPPPQEPFDSCGRGTDEDKSLGCVASSCP